MSLTKITLNAKSCQVQDFDSLVSLKESNPFELIVGNLLYRNSVPTITYHIEPFNSAVRAVAL